MSYSNEDLDFTKLIKIILEGKYILLFSIISFLVLGIVYLNLQETVYSSKIKIIINDRPPDQSNLSGLKNDRKIIYDFKTLVYDKKNFNRWREINNTDIQYDDFTIFEEFESLIFEKKNNKLKFNLIYSGDYLVGESFIDINTNQKSIILDYLDYFNYTNRNLMKNYLSEASNIKFLENNETTALANLIFNFLENKNNQIIVFDKPTIPVKVYPSLLKILIIFLFFGSLAGVVSLSLVETFKNKKKINLIFLLIY